MKKYRFLVLLLISNIANIVAQVNNTAEFGLKLGTNYTIPKMEDFSSMEFNNQFGIDLGFYLNFPISRHIGIRSEVLYSSQSIHMESYGIGDQNGQRIGRVDLNEKFKDAFTTFPILLNIKVAKRLNVLTGPQFGFLISNEKRFLIRDKMIFFQNEPIDYFRFSGNIELSYKPTEKVSLGIRYNLGFNTVNNLKNSGLQMHLAYSLF